MTISAIIIVIVFALGFALGYFYNDAKNKTTINQLNVAEGAEQIGMQINNDSVS